jgi:type I restriction enzyme M protein
MGTLVDRVHRELTDVDIIRIASTYHAWRGDKGASLYEDEAGFCKSANTKEIADRGYKLAPSPFVGNLVTSDEDDPFIQKMPRL